ncbi:MAG: glycogen/starch synthase, partial [Candidatus Omnitrophota bacterium]
MAWVLYMHHVEQFDRKRADEYIKVSTPEERNDFRLMMRCILPDCLVLADEGQHRAARYLMKAFFKMPEEEKRVTQPISQRFSAEEVADYGMQQRFQDVYKRLEKRDGGEFGNVKSYREPKELLKTATNGWLVLFDVDKSSGLEKDLRREFISKINEIIDENVVGKIEGSGVFDTPMSQKYPEKEEGFIHVPGDFDRNVLGRMLENTRIEVEDNTPLTLTVAAVNMKDVFGAYPGWPSFTDSKRRWLVEEKLLWGNLKDGKAQGGNRVIWCDCGESGGRNGVDAADMDGGEETLITVLPEGLIPDRGVEAIASLRDITVKPSITSYGDFDRIGGRMVDVFRAKDSGLNGRQIVIKRFNPYLSHIQWPVEVLYWEAIVNTSHPEVVLIDGWQLIKIPQVSAFRYLPGMLIQQLTVESYCRVKYRELAKAFNRQGIIIVDGFNTVSNIGNIRNEAGEWEGVLVDNNSIKPGPSRIKRFLGTLTGIDSLAITNREVLDFVRKNRQRYGRQLLRGFSAEDVVLAASYHRARTEGKTVKDSLREALGVWKFIYDNHKDGYTDSSFVKQLDGGKPVLSVVTEVPAKLQMHTPLPPIKRDRKFQVYADWVMLYGLAELLLYALKWKQNGGIPAGLPYDFSGFMKHIKWSKAQGLLEITPGEELSAWLRDYFVNAYGFFNIRNADLGIETDKLLEDLEDFNFIRYEQGRFYFHESQKAKMAIWAQCNFFISDELQEFITEDGKINDPGRMLKLMSEYALGAAESILSPVEARQPFLSAVLDLPPVKRNGLSRFLKEKRESLRGMYVSELADAVLFMMYQIEDMKQWARKNLPALENRNTHIVSPEISALAGGLGRMMQYLIRSYKKLGIRAISHQPYYLYQLDQRGYLNARLDYADSLYSPLKIEDAPCYTFTITVQNQPVVVDMYKAYDEDGSVSYLYRDKGDYFVKGLYCYDECGNGLPNEFVFCEFFTKAVLKGISHIEGEAKRKDPISWRPPVAYLHDGQSALAAVWPLFDREYQNEVTLLMEYAFCTHTYFNRKTGDLRLRQILLNAGVTEKWMWLFRRQTPEGSEIYDLT